MYYFFEFSEYENFGDIKGYVNCECVNKVIHVGCITRG